MYVAKKTRRRIETKVSDQQEPDPTAGDRV
jgi:hypothetical protein